MYEHAVDVNRILHRMKRFGGTFSGEKVVLGVPEIQMVGYVCSFEGRGVPKSAVAKLLKWDKMNTRTEVKRFLGLVGIARSWIKNYGAMVRPLVRLTAGEEQDIRSKWGPEHDEALTAVKEAVVNCGIIKPLDYSRADVSPPILSVDASQTGCGGEIAQVDENGKRRTARFFSIYYNEVQQRYSQPKLELYGVFVAMQAARLWLHGVKFILETD